MTSDDRRLSYILGIPSFALSLAIAVLSTYLPVLARKFTSSTAVIGLLVGGEGLIAVLLPVWIGRLSDRSVTRLGRRLPYLLASAPLAALALVLLPFADSLGAMAIEVFLFYLAYFTYYSPYRALYPDLISTEASARAQGIQGVFTGAGLGVALVGGGFLLELWRPLPYLAGAGLLLAATGFVAVTIPHAGAPASLSDRTQTSPFADLWGLLRGDRAILQFVVGNALLTLALGGMKSFVVLWLTEGLGKSINFTAGAMVVVALGTVVGALVAGKMGDRDGPAQVLNLALFIFGIGLIVGTFTTSVWLLGIAFPVIALCGGAAFALPYAVLMRLTPSRKHGMVAGLFDASSGMGTLLGPALTGVAIDVLRPLFPSTRGYAAMWPVLSISILGSMLILRRAAANRTPDDEAVAA